MKPIVAIYSTFLQRAYDQLIHDVAIQNLPVLFALDRAGLVPDGPTHSGCFDLSFLRCIPNLIVMTPSDASECRLLLTTGYHSGSPALVRYPRGNSPSVSLQPCDKLLPIGKANVIREGKQIAILCFGTLLANALIVANKIDATLVDMRFVKPLDTALILALAKTHPVIVTLEENVVMGGAGEGVNSCLLAHDCQNKVINLGIPDHFVEHATPHEMLASCNLDPEGILASIMKRVPTMLESTQNHLIIS